MKLLVVSHACASAVNFGLFTHVERQTGWDITVLRPANWRNEYGSLVNEDGAAILSAKILGAPVWKSGNIILHVYRRPLRRLLRELKPDAIYVHHEPYALATAQVFLANRSTVRCPIGFYSAQNILKRYPPPFCVTESMVLRQSSFFFPVSETVEKVFRTKGYAGLAAVLPLGIDPSVYFPRAEGRGLRERLSSRPDEVLLGYVGRLVPEKGLLTLLQALARIADLNWRLVVVGSGPMEEQFDACSASLGLKGRIVRVGFVPHDRTPDYLSAFDVLVVPSETQPNWKEQFGRVIIEAMACGAAVVGSDSGEIPRLIADTGGGLVFKERQADQLAQQIARMITDSELRSVLSGTGREAVQSRYSLPAIAGQFARTVSAALGQTPPTRSIHGQNL